MAATLLLIAGLAAAEPAPAVQPAQAATDQKAADAALFDAAAGCAAYHVYVASIATPGSEEAKFGEQKAILFLLASYAKLPEDNPAAAEAKIEETVTGLYEDSVTVEPEQHKREMEELKQVCIQFEPAATAIVDEAGLTPETK